ncbi:MAG TPA: VOC family protein [Gaiellaceae bacterium]|nr:VOC family protein [Gaiellaceae bacterium]
MLTDTPRVVYRVHDFGRARDFYKRVLGFEETYVDFDESVAALRRGPMHIALATGDPDPEGGVAMVDVDDVLAEAARLRGDGVKVGTVVEIAGELRLVDVYDPEGNRIQLSESVQ